MSDVYLNGKGKFVRRRIMKKRYFVVYYSDGVLFADKFGEDVWFSEPVCCTKSNLNRKLSLLCERYEYVYYVEYRDGHRCFMSDVIWNPDRRESSRAE
nr:MAG TPA: hypothetical protein [Microviridae sp.]